MITVRNEDTANSVSARAGAASLKAGMLVVLAQGAASGDQPTCVKATAADIADQTVRKFIVDYEQKDSLDVDFDIDVTDSSLTVEAKTIPNGAQVNLWYGDIVIAYHESLLPTGAKAADLREGTQKIGWDADTGLPAKYNSAGTKGEKVALGVVYRIDGPEVTMLVNTYGLAAAA